MEANGIATRKHKHVPLFNGLTVCVSVCVCVLCVVGPGGADLSAIVNTCVQASSRPFTWRLKEAQHQRFMAPREEKEVCY